MQRPPKIPNQSYKNFFAIPKLQRPEGTKNAYFMCPMCDFMGSTVRNAMIKLSNECKEVTKFTSVEISTMLRIFLEIKREVGPNMTYKVLQKFLHLTFDIFCPQALDGITRAFDRKNRKMIGPYDFVYGMSVLLRGSIDDRAEFAFRVFDFDCDGYIRRNVELAGAMQEIFNTDIAAMNPNYDPEEPYRDSVDYVMKKLDCDGDGKISYQDFCQAVKSNPLLMESCFVFWPSQESVMTFQRLFLTDCHLPAYV